jgi:hypothetical protein
MGGLVEHAMEKGFRHLAQRGLVLSLQPCWTTTSCIDKSSFLSLEDNGLHTRSVVVSPNFTAFTSCFGATKYMYSQFRRNLRIRRAIGG